MHLHLEEKDRNQLKETLRRQRHIGYKKIKDVSLFQEKKPKLLLPGVEYPVLRTAINTSLLILWLTVQMPKGVHPTKCFWQQTITNLWIQIWLLFIIEHFIRICSKKSTALDSTWQQRWTRKQEMKWAGSRPHHLTSLLWEWIKTQKPEYHRTS